MTDLKCPYCDLKISIHIPDDVSPEELKMIKTCSCGKMMETAEESTGNGNVSQGTLWGIRSCLVSACQLTHIGNLAEAWGELPRKSQSGKLHS